MERRMTGDGLRSVCPQFKARWSWQGGYYISCGGKKIRFSSQDARNRHYERHCCRVFGVCEIHIRRENMK